MLTEHVPEFKQLSDLVEHFKAEGCYILPNNGGAVVKENQNHLAGGPYGEYHWHPPTMSWVRLGTRLGPPQNAIEWMEFKDVFVTDMATRKVTKIRYGDGKPSRNTGGLLALGEPPFKPGDWCVAEGFGWAYVPLLIEHALSYGGGTWWYGNTDVRHAKFRHITEDDLEIMYQAELREANRHSRLAADKITLLCQILSKKGKSLSKAGTLTVEME
jgi:hypothetical protein